MKQWKELKGKHPDALLLFRIGDFYEMYKQDAKRGSEVLGMTLTKMNEVKTSILQDFHIKHLTPTFQNHPSRRTSNHMRPVGIKEDSQPKLRHKSNTEQSIRHCQGSGQAKRYAI